MSDETIKINKSEWNNIKSNQVAITRQLMQNQINGYTGHKHDVYKSAGYPEEITFEMYWRMFQRGGIAERTLTVYTNDTWMKNPIVKEITANESNNTQFNKSITQMEDDLKLWNELMTFDEMSGIGRYGGLLIGFDDGVSLDQEVKKANNVIFIKPLPEKFMVPNEIDKDISSTRYGQPINYRVETENGDIDLVHWTRLIHFTWKVLESKFYGIPAMKSIYNYLLDIEKISAASGEGYWKGAYPGFSIEFDKEVQITEPNKEQMKTQTDNYESDMKRSLAIQGGKVNQFKPVVASPEKQLDSNLTLIAGAKGIPKRKLLGNEAGELASSQDQANWSGQIKNRQETLIIPMIIEAFIDRLISVGVLPNVKYAVVFPDIYAPSEKEMLENSALLIDVITAYLDGPASEILPLVEFLMQVMGYKQEEAEAIEDRYYNIIKEEEAETKPTTNNFFKKLMGRK